MATRTLHVIVCETGEPFDVATWDGLAHAELQGAVAARGGLCPASLYCTFARDRRGPVAPLSASLPDGATLYAHGAPARRTTSRGGGRPARGDGDAAPPAARKASDERATAEYFALGDDAEAPAPRESPRAPSDDDDDADRQSVAAQLTAVERFSRLTTELANERTLLAWIRTTLASMRTAYSLSSLESNDGAFWRVLTEGAELTICLFVVATAFNGIVRYQRIKNALLSTKPLRRFGRLTLRPYNGLTSLVAVAVAIVIFQRRLLVNAYAKK